MANATMVMVGFCQPELTKLAPSTTNRFLMVVALAPLVEDAGLGVVAHAAGAELVDAVAGWVGIVVFGEDFKACGFGQRDAGVDGVACHVEFVVGVLGLDAEGGDAPGVDYVLCRC